MLQKLWANKFLVVTVLMTLFLALFLHQCGQTKKAKGDVEMVKHIAEQNMAALHDSTIQLMVTKEQLKKTDTNLYSALQKVDSIGKTKSKTKSKTITVARPVYVGGPTTTATTLEYDSNKHTLGLKFSSIDPVRTIEGISWFELKKGIRDSTVIVPDSTVIRAFNLNFTLVISQYDDKSTHYTRTRIIPFHVNTDGTLGDPIPSSLLTVSFRNAEILDKPYTPNTDNKRLGFQSGWALTVNPFALGAYPKDGGMGWGWTPNIGFGYYLTLRKK